jgi:hypothetical protein
MPPKPEKPPGLDEISEQIRAMQLHIENLTQQQETFQSFLTTHIPSLLNNHFLMLPLTLLDLQ